MKYENNSTASYGITRPSDETVLVWLVPLVVFGVLIVASNLVTIVTFVVNRYLLRRGLYCLVNLAVADVLYGAVLTAYSSCVFGVTFFDLSVDFKTRGMFIPSLLTMMGSLLSLVAVSLERVYATFFPFRHRTARPRIYILVFAITWSLALLTSLLYHLIPKAHFKGAVAFYWFLLTSSLIVIIISYTAVFIKIKTQNQFHQQHRQQAAITITRLRERHLAMTLFIVTVLSLLTWLPFLLVRVLNPVRYNFYGRLRVLTRSYSVVFLFQSSNSLINPIVYLFRMRDLRNALFKLVCKCSQQRVHPLNG
jgi:hypothetical protein